MNTYYKYTDTNLVNCYLELNNDFFCERIVFISSIFEVDDRLFYYEGEEYNMPSSCFKNKIKHMVTINKEDFENNWKKTYTGNDDIKFLIKQISINHD